MCSEGICSPVVIPEGNWTVGTDNKGTLSVAVGLCSSVLNIAITFVLRNPPLASTGSAAMIQVEFRVWGRGFGVEGLGLKVEDLEFMGEC